MSVNDAQAQGDRQLARGEVAFVVTIPEGFTRQLLRREQPQLLLEADATDPAASSNALAAATQLTRTALAHQRLGAAGADTGQPPFDLVMHRRYNPDGISQYNTVPGLLGVILTMTMVMMPALALTREVERGTMENLLALPVRPMEMMIGKLLPYIAMGAVQVVIILTVAHWVFEVPMQGSYPLLCVMLALFIATVSTMGLPDLDRGAQPDAGDADDVLLLSALDAAVGLHVSVPRHAGVGAGHRRSVAADAFSAHRTWHHAEGWRLCRCCSQYLATAAVSGSGVGDCAEPLPAYAGFLKQR